MYSNVSLRKNWWEKADHKKETSNLILQNGKKEREPTSSAIKKREDSNSTCEILNEMVKCGGITMLFSPVHWQAHINLEIEDVNLHMTILRMLVMSWEQKKLYYQHGTNLLNRNNK